MASRFCVYARHGRQLGGESPLWVRQSDPLARGKGVRREAEYEGSPRQNHGLRNTNLIRGCTVRVSWQDTAKPETAKGRRSRWGGRGVKVGVLIRGGQPESQHRW